MVAIAEEFAASTEVIAAAGQEQLASTETIAQPSRELYILAGGMNTEVNKIKSLAERTTLPHLCENST